MNLEVLYTQDFPLDNLNHDLGTPKCGLWKEGSLYPHFLFLTLEVEEKVMETLALKREFGLK